MQQSHSALDEPDYAAYVLDAFGAADYEFNLQTHTLRPSPRLNALYDYLADYPLTSKRPKRGW